MSLEAGVLLGLEGYPLHWHKPVDRTAASLPDSVDLWEIIWENRKGISGFAHSHPSGFAAPSSIDLTTFAAVEAALGARLDWWIATPSHLVLTRWVGPDRLHYKTVSVTLRPTWFNGLLELSEY